MCSNRPRREAGFTFAELAFGLLILVITSVVLLNHLAVNYDVTRSERDRVFAFSKAQAILSEIQSYVDRYQIEAVDLDTMDDGAVHKETLSIQQDQYGALVPPDHVVSGNLQRNGQWLWTRRISVQPFASLDNRNVRYVTVHIYHRDDKGTESSVADLSAVINSAGQSYPSTQVYDCYLFAIENIPGWWVFMDSIRPFMESMIMDLETRNPGLELRTHWITKASFGRNRLYRPYTNNVLDSNAAIPDVYSYPGRMPAGNASAFYYVPDNMKARINVEGVEVNGYDATENPYPYALADYFNHAMRYPDELALWNQRVATITQREADIAAAIAGGTNPPAELPDMSKEPTLRLFLEDLYSNPNKYKNALLMNLHGELLPMPALRNYSDPAKSQVAYPDLRVVTHPEELRTRRNQAGVTDPLRFRMYAFDDTISTNYPAATVPAAKMAVPMVVDVMGVNLTLSGNPSQIDTTQCVLQFVSGLGSTTVAVANTYAAAWAAAVPWTSALETGGSMCYRTQWVTTEGPQPFTRIYLYNTPRRCPLDSSNRGLARTARAKLYWMDYVPCPVNFDAANGPQFTPDLTTASSTLPKNTARWTLQINASILAAGRVFTETGGAYTPNSDLRVEVRTRIATGYTSVPWTTTGGAAFPAAVDPDNLSKTYAWWASSLEAVPFTERAQFLGDPRHEPYKDCFKSGSTVISEYPNAYNWYFDDLASTSPSENTFASAPGDYPSIDSTLLKDVWNSGSPMRCDTPRFMQILREGLIKSGIVYTSLTGWSYYYMGIGNDIGYDSANGYASSIPSSLQPYGGAVGSTGYIDNIIYATSGASGRNYRNYVRDTNATYWWGMPWLGELYPDTVLTTQWLNTSGGTPRGNLSAGIAASQFYQKDCNSVYNPTAGTRHAFGTTLTNAGQRAATYGCTTLFNIGNAASTFQHSSSNANGTLTAVGTEIGTNYNVSVPTTAPITRPFTINAAMSPLPEHFLLAPYSTKCTASVFQTYYSHPAGQGSAVVKLVNSAGTGAAYIIVNGIANTVTNGTSFIAQWNLLTLVHTMLAAGSTTNTFRIQEQPRIEIKSPTDITELNNPASIQVKYGITWRRWDGLPYAQTGTYGETEGQLQYAISYSRDGGNTWLHIQDDSPATPGVLPAPAYLYNDLVAGDETFNWDVSAGYPEGTYELRIDCFRIGANVHYAYHRTRLYIQR